MIASREFNIESETPRPIRAGMMRDQDIGAATGIARVNRLTNSRFRLGEIAREVNRTLTLFTIHRARFHAQFSAFAIGFSAPAASHAAHSRFASQRAAQ